MAALFAALARYDFGAADRLADTAPRQHFVCADFAGDFLRVAMVAEGSAGLTDMHREILEVETEPDDELLATHRAMLVQA